MTGRQRLPVWIILTGTLIYSLYAQTTTGGYWKGLLMEYHQPSLTGNPSGEYWQTACTGLFRFRLLHSRGPVRIEAAYQLTPLLTNGDFGRPLNLTILTAPHTPVYRLADLHETMIATDGMHFKLDQNLDRLNVSITTARADIIIGRQVIAFGAARFINPTDIFAPLAWHDLNREDRRGVDAIRVKIAAGQNGMLDAGLVLGRGGSRENSAIYGRAQWQVAGNGFSFTGALFSDNLMLGADFTRSIGGAGIWAEAAGTLAGVTSQRKTRQDYIRLSTGFDYSFGRLYMAWEYHYNGAGKAEPRLFIRNLLENAYNEGGVYLMGRHYLAPGLAWQATPLMNLRFTSLASLTDRSIFFWPRLEYNLRQDLYLETGGFLTIGSVPRQNRIQSEFGTYPDIYYLSIRRYF